MYSRSLSLQKLEGERRDKSLKRECIGRAQKVARNATSSFSLSIDVAMALYKRYEIPPLFCIFDRKHYTAITTIT